MTFPGLGDQHPILRNRGLAEEFTGFGSTERCGENQIGRRGRDGMCQWVLDT